MNVASLEIKGYEGLYWIDANGVINTVIRKGTKGQIRKHCTNRYGYKYVGLTKNGVRKNYTIHQLLAKHFIPNPKNYKYVNHINGNKADNRLENLEWCSASDNCKHAYATGLKQPAGVAVR